MLLVFRNVIFIRRVCIVPPPNNIPCPLCGVEERERKSVKTNGSNYLEGQYHSCFISAKITVSGQLAGYAKLGIQHL